MITNKIKGLWVPIDILHNEKLTSTEKLVLAVIYGLSKDGRCTASNQYIAEITGSGPKNVEKIIPKLEKMEFFSTKHFKDEKNIHRRIIYPPY